MDLNSNAYKGIPASIKDLFRKKGKSYASKNYTRLSSKKYRFRRPVGMRSAEKDESE